MFTHRAVALLLLLPLVVVGMPLLVALLLLLLLLLFVFCDFLWFCLFVCLFVCFSPAAAAAAAAASGGGGGGGGDAVPCGCLLADPSSDAAPLPAAVAAAWEAGHVWGSWKQTGAEAAQSLGAGCWTRPSHATLLPSCSRIHPSVPSIHHSLAGSYTFSNGWLA